MNKYLIIANWKMNPKTAKEAAELLVEIQKSSRAKNSEIVVCPPFVFLADLARMKKTGISLGGQNCHWEAAGPYTGEVSAQMLADIKAKYVILGHSSRRKYLGETDEIINLKIKAALKVGLKPIVCVGENAGEHIEEIVEKQLTGIFKGISSGQLKNIFITYEPVWAISTSSSSRGCCRPDDALSAALFIRRVMAKLYSRFFSEKLNIIYGGSVDSQNARDYLVKSGMAGVLVGAASLKAGEFAALVNSLN